MTATGSATMLPCPAGDTCYGFLLRHGATDSNLAQPPRLQGSGLDGSLSAAGRQQAIQATRQLSAYGLQAVYSSPLKRARETAELLAQPHGLSVQLVPEITEINVGAWEGRSWVDIAREEPDDYQRFVDDPATYGYRDGETLADVQRRVAPAIERLLRQHLGSHIAIVAHNVVNRVYLASVMGLPLARARTLDQDNCGINILRCRGDQTQLLSMNAIFHLHEATWLAP